MEDDINATLLERGIVKFPPNVHGIYVERQLSGTVRLLVRQNDREMSFVLESEAIRHLAAVLLKSIE